MITILRWIWNYKELISLQNPYHLPFVFETTFSDSWENTRTSHSTRIKDLDLDLICHDDILNLFSLHEHTAAHLCISSEQFQMWLRKDLNILPRWEIKCTKSGLLQHPCMEKVGAGKGRFESMDWIYTANHEVNCGSVINQKLMSLLSAVSTWTTPSMYFHSVNKDGKKWTTSGLVIVAAAITINYSENKRYCSIFPLEACVFTDHHLKDWLWAWSCEHEHDYVHEV